MGTNGHQRQDGADRPGQQPDQTLGDSDQTLSDSDQTLSDSDQTLSDRDQTASDSDQAAADAEHDEGCDPVYERSTAVRDEGTRERLEIGALRDQGAGERDSAAQARDATATQRDRNAAARDLTDRAFEANGARTGPGSRDAGAVSSRAAQARDRAAADRGHAARDRKLAATDRAQAARERDLAGTDELTGARRRGVGLAEVARDIERARRDGDSLVAVFVDVDGLKSVNDERGHAAGDAVLLAVVAGLRRHMRSYDLVVRLGGDEFLCAMTNISADEARARFSGLNAELHGSASLGFAQLEDGKDLTDLMERADRDLLEAKRAR